MIQHEEGKTRKREKLCFYHDFIQEQFSAQHLVDLWLGYSVIISSLICQINSLYFRLKKRIALLNQLYQECYTWRLIGSLLMYVELIHLYIVHPVFLAILYVDTNNFKIVVFVIVMRTYGIFRHVYVINKSFWQNGFFILCFSQ